MPTYDYICDSCGHGFEAFESITADPQSVCPACNEPALRRKIGPGAAILFKGSGFYQTDYRSDSYTKAAKADQPSSSSGSSENSGSSGGSQDSGGSSNNSSTSSSNGSASSNSSSRPSSSSKSD